MRTRSAFLLVLALAGAPAAAQTRTAKTLDIYVVDVEGGNAVLFVSPSAQSLLIDTGNAGAAAVRDADRIMAAVKERIKHEDRGDRIKAIIPFRRPPLARALEADPLHQRRSCCSSDAPVATLLDNAPAGAIIGL